MFDHFKNLFKTKCIENETFFLFFLFCLKFWFNFRWERIRVNSATCTPKSTTRRTRSAHFPRNWSLSKKNSSFLQKESMEAKTTSGETSVFCMYGFNHKCPWVGEGVPPRKIYGGWAGVKKYLHFFSISL